MTVLRTRAAVTPLRRRFASQATMLPSVDSLIAAELPEEPMHCLRPATVQAAARAFTGCMKWISATGNIWRTRRTSAMEAQSK